jgi:hypothetical protein
MSDHDQSEREKGAREIVRKIRDGARRSISKDGGRQFLRSHLQTQDTAFLLAAAREGSLDAIEILRIRGRAHRDAGTPVSIDFQAFVWEYFLDGPPPGPPGPRPEETLVRNMIVISLIKILNEDGLSLSRPKSQHDSKTGPFSAPAIIAQEFGLGEAAVEKIWSDGKANVGR